MKIFSRPTYRRSWLIASLVGSVFALSACGGGGGDGRDPILGANGIATLQPAVTVVVPAPNATSVSVNTKILTAQFNKAMDASTLTATSMRLACPAGVPVTATVVSYLAPTMTAQLQIPAATQLPPNTLCSATVASTVKDTYGIALAADYVWTFTTGAIPDTTAPMVTATVAPNGATGVSINSSGTVTFSEAMDPATINTSTYTMMQGATPVTGTVSYAGTIATFRPTTQLAPSTTYTSTIAVGAKDLAGNPLANPFVWSWTTGAAPDTTAPMVTATVAPNGATGVSINSNGTVTFSEAMDPATINTSTYTMMQGATPVTGTVSYAGTIATFRPTAPLASSTTYTSTIAVGAKDLAGNPLANPFVWSWTTGAAPDTTAPTIVATAAYGSTGFKSPDATRSSFTGTNLPVNRSTTATFSEPMDVTTMTNVNFTLAQGATPVAGTVSYVGNTISFKPLVDLLPTTTYTSTVTTGAKDLAGNALAAAYIWTWTTLATGDTTAPTLTSTVPANLATGVPVNQEVSAVFSEAMAPLTITNASFTLKQGLIPVAGTVVASGSGATFTPSAPLANNTTYTAQINNTAQDLAGNALAPSATPNPWTFTTGAVVPPVAAGPAAVNLTCAANFTVLAGSGITNTGPSILSGGDVGLSPGSAVVGFPPGTLNGGVFHISDPIADNAKLCLTAAYNDAAGRSLAPITVSGNIGGQTLAPGLYKSTSTLAISSGDLTLSGPADAVWIFQVASTLTTTAGRQVILAGGAQAKNVFWQVGTSATLGTTSVMQGTIMADQSITLQTGAVLNGRALTRIAAVTLDSATITKP